MADNRLTRNQIDEYADLSTDRNPLHTDEEFASSSRFGGIIAHGFLLLGQPLDRLAEEFSYPLTLTCRFRSAGRPGDVLRTEFGPAGSGELPFEVSTADGEVRVVGTLAGNRHRRGRDDGNLSG